MDKLLYKTENTNTEDEMRVKVLSALADISRIQIIRVLHAEKRELCCGDIIEYVGMPKSTASYHFKTLHEAELILSRKESLRKYISIRYETFEKYLPSFLDNL